MSHSLQGDTVPAAEGIPPGRGAMRTLRLLAGNVVSLLATDVANRMSTFILYLLVGRYLGTYAFGQMTVGLTLFHAFRVIAVTGLKTLITREVAADKSKTASLLVNGVGAALLSSAVSLLAMLALTLLMGYSAQTTAVILLLALGLIPSALMAISEAVFQAWEKMHYIVYANVPANGFKVVVAVVLLARGYGLYPLILVLDLAFVLAAIIEWWWVVRRISAPQSSFSLHQSWLIVRQATAFLGINLILAIRTSLNVVLLSKLATEVEAGLYNAAMQFALPLLLISESVGVAIFPVMCRGFESGLGVLKRLSESAIELLQMVTLPFVVGLFILAEQALRLVYGVDFLQASDSLRILIWSEIFRVFTQVLGRVLWASEREKLSLQIVAANTLLWFVLGLVLIDRFGLIGAAVNTLLSQMLDFVLHYVPIARLLSGISLIGPMWKPTLASAVMAAFLLLVGDRWLLLVVSAGALVYGVTLLMLALWTAGGRRKLQAQMLAPWVE